jgi:hypothetical protein
MRSGDRFGFSGRDGEGDRRAVEAEAQEDGGGLDGFSFRVQSVRFVSHLKVDRGGLCIGKGGAVAGEGEAAATDGRVGDGFEASLEVLLGGVSTFRCGPALRMIGRS